MGRPDPPAKPILYVNDTTEAQKARVLPERFHIAFDVCHTSDPYR